MWETCTEQNPKFHRRTSSLHERGRDLGLALSLKASEAPAGVLPQPTVLCTGSKISNAIQSVRTRERRGSNISCRRGDFGVKKFHSKSRN